jgi:hypothetical protein
MVRKYVLRTKQARGVKNKRQLGVEINERGDKAVCFLTEPKNACIAN